MRKVFCVKSLSKSLCSVFFVFSVLFSHVAFSQIPSVGAIGGQSEFPTESFCIDATLTNSGNEGYGPYLQLIVPEGLTFDSSSLFGSAITPINVGVFGAPPPPGNELTDTIINQQVTGPENGTLYLLQPPIGSVVTGGPALAIQLCFTIDAVSPVNTPMDVTLTPVYEFGDTPTGDNGPILGAGITFNVTPVLVEFRKEDNVPEGERPPGPSWPVTYTLTADIASGNTVDNIVIADTLPTNFIMTSFAVIPAAAPNCSIAVGATLTVNCLAIIGTNADDVVVTYTGYYDDVLDEATCGTDMAINTATFDGEFANAAIAQLSDMVTIEIEHTSIQKSAFPFENVSPGTTVTFTVNIQLSDFGTANSIQLQDILPDGYTFTAGSETISFGAITATANELLGVTTLDFDVTAANGGDIAAGTAITLTYEATVDTNYDNGDPLLASDTLTNTITNTYGLSAGGAACTDTSAATVTLEPVTVSKELITMGPYVPGQTVTYRLSMDVPSGDTQNVSFTDFFPLPVFVATTINTNTDLGINPDITLSLTDTLGLVPTSITTDGGSNSLVINWPDITTAMAQTLSVEVSVDVTTEPFADNLNLSNLLQVDTENTAGAPATDTTPVLIQVRSPKLEVTKGVIAADQGVITPAIGTAPEDGDIVNIDAGDSITYQVTIENQGGAIADNIVITDPVIPELSGCAVVSVLDGTGAVLPTTGTLAAGLSLTNPLAENDGTVGAPYGADTALVTYSCTITAAVAAGSIFTNTASAVFSSVGGAATPFPEVTDTATATVLNPTISKTIIATAPNADGDNSTVTIGETIQYQVVMAIPEGVTPAATLVDTLDAGLVFQSFDSITPSSGDVTTTAGGGYAGVLGAATGLGTGTATFDFVNLVNINNDNATAETVTIVYTVLVQDVAGNTNGGLRNNTAVLDYTDGSATGTAPNVTIVEPNLTINKTVNPTTADAGDTVTYTIVVTNTGTTTAYATTVSDDLASPFLNLIEFTVTTTQGMITAGNSIGATTVGVNIGDIAVGGVVTIMFDVVLDASTPSGASIVNTGSIDGYNSLPGGNGRVYGPTTDTATVSATAAVVTKSTIPATSTEQSIGNTSDQGNGALVDLTIGEEVTFEIVATLAEGVSPSVIITDTLPLNATGHMEVTGFSILPLPATTNLTLSVPNPANTGVTANVLELDFGSVTNVADGTVDADDQIIIQITAIVVDAGVNSGLEVLTNNVMVQYNAGLTASSSSDVEVVEPRMTVNKAGSANTADAGDTITFTITIDNLAANNSQANAFDVDLTDVIPADYTYVAASLTQVSGPVADGGTLIENAGTIQATWTQFDLTQTAVVSYQVTVDNTVAPEQVITNTANLAWTSMPGVNAAERSGSASEGHNVTITAPGVSKSVTDTSELSSGSARLAPANQDILIGETVTYQFTITIPEGTSVNASAFDQLPTVSTIMNVVSSRIVSIGGQLMSTLPAVIPGQAGVASNTDADIYNDLVTWDLGDLFNMPDGLNNAGDQLTFEVVAMLVDEAVNQNGGMDIVNTATFSHDPDGVGGLPPIESTDTALIDIIEPIITVDKHTVPAAITADAGDVLDYQITITNPVATSNADAFNFTVTDVLPTPGTNWINNATVTSNCGVVTTDSAAAPIIVFTFSQLVLGATCNIDYKVSVNIGINPNVTYQNTVTTTYTSTSVINPETRTGSVMDSTSFVTPDPAIIKVSASSSLVDTLNNVQDGLLPDLAIGEEIDFTITIIFPEGTTTNAVVVDSLPVLASGGILEAVSATVDSIGGSLVSSLPGTPVFSDVDGDVNAYDDTITFDFGTVINTPDAMVNVADEITITVTARVVDDVVNVDLDTMTNTAVFTFDTSDLLNPLTDTADVEVVEPILGLTKTMGPMVDFVVPITLTFANTGNAPAYDITIEDILDTNIWDVATISAVVTPAGYTFASTAGPGANQQTVSYTINNSVTDFIAAGATQVFTFNVTLRDDVVLPTTIPNTATVTEVSSLPGADPSERDLSDIIGTASLLLPSLDSDKAVTLVADSNGSGGASPGEVLEYTITIVNSGDGAATGVLLADVPDANVTLIVGSVTTTIGAVTTGNNAGNTMVDVNIGTIPAMTTATIVYQVTINNPLAIGVIDVTNQGMIESNEVPDIVTDDPSTVPNDDPTVVPIDGAPDLVVTKDDGSATTAAGNLIVYGISYQNIGTQDAVNVVITETVPANTTYNAGASTAGWSCAATTPGSLCTINIGNVNAGDAAVTTLDFAITVDDPIIAGQTEVANTISIADDGSNGVDLNPGNNTDIDTDTFSSTPDLQIIKDDSITAIVPGGTITYTLTYTNVGGQNATNVVISETVPANTTFDAAASDVGWVCADVIPGSACTFDIANLAGGGGTGSIEFVVTLDDPIGIGVDGIINTASITDDGANGVDPTPGDNTSTHPTDVSAFPDLFVTKSDGGISSGPGQTIIYTLSYGNQGNQGSTNAFLTEVVPANSTYNAGASSVAWVCAGGSTAPGTICTHALGTLNIGDTGSVTFAVDVDDPLAVGVNQILNSTVIDDDNDNNQGDLDDDSDPTNDTGTDTTSLELLPPVGIKTGEFDPADNRLIHWTVVWYNPNNDRDLPIFAYDDIPANTIYAGNESCTVDGTSSCIGPVFNAGLNRIEITAILGEDQGAPLNSTPATLNNEIIVKFDTRVIGSGNFTIENQALANWDENNDGDPLDDEASGQVPIPTDDPGVIGTDNPTALSMAYPIPTLNIWSLLLLILTMLSINGLYLSNREN